MLKTFFFGILLGLVVAAGALYAFPVVDQHREASIITVAPNGGNVETFHINMPADRIMHGAAAQRSPLPEGLVWPSDELILDVQAELFKVRDARDAVIGIASRTTVEDEVANGIEWVIHLPARGSIFFMMDAATQEDGHRLGALRAGSREFDAMVGTMTERWIADDSGDVDAPLGRIELRASYARLAESAE